jgi:hypothetical protein
LMLAICLTSLAYLAVRFWRGRFGARGDTAASAS